MRNLLALGAQVSGYCVAISLNKSSLSYSIENAKSTSVWRTLSLSINVIALKRNCGYSMYITLQTWMGELIGWPMMGFFAFWFIEQRSKMLTTLLGHAGF